MRKTLHIVLFIFVASISHLEAQKYFVSFSDKNNNTYSIDSPAEFLSQRAINRRIKQNISISSQDLPVTPSYLDSVKNMGVDILWSSKWLNGVIIESDNTQLMDTISRVLFITESKLIWKQPIGNTTQKFIESESPLRLKSASEYGSSWNQTKTVNGQYLHQNNYSGEGMVIAVLDNGFNKVDVLSTFKHLWDNDQILSSRDVVNPGGDVYVGGSHGTNVLSVMGGFISGEFKGSAPKAAYHLLRTEDNASEYPIEEYNWVLGAEYADSIGADIINSSLGYYLYDGDFTDYTYEDMDGKTTIVVRGAEIAFSKGMVVVCSAGNEGGNSWGKIISPADGENVLAVAAMRSDSLRASFSSYGPSADGRIKPDVTAIGQNAALQNLQGDIVFANGTSFSAPVMAGFVTCLWQAFPKMKNIELVQLVKENGHNYLSPDSSFGYGIPNFKAALQIENSIAVINTTNFRLFPNPFNNHINITSDNITWVDRLSVYDITGHIVYEQQQVILPNKISQLDNLPQGVYLLKLDTQSYTHTYKIIKK